MGCNSHLAIEIRNRWKTDDHWSVWALDLPEARYYQLYETMAGVRGNEDNAVVVPRGIPLDASSGVAYWIKRAGEDGHTHSWLSPIEFHEALTKAQGWDSKEWLSLEKVLFVLQETYGEDNVRLVFFFDN